MTNHPNFSVKQNYLVGMIMFVVGCIGFIAGLVPFCIALIQLWNHVKTPSVSPVFTLLDHGARAMGLSVEWALLSSTAGMILGFFLMWSGIGWMKNYSWARIVTYAYIISGISINAVDLIIFLIVAKAGVIRNTMIAFDIIAFLFPVIIAIWLFTLHADTQAKRDI